MIYSLVLGVIPSFFIKHIYHSSLTVESTSLNDTHSSFLDIDITIKEYKIISKVYNKTDDYNFTIARYPNFRSCVPKSIFKGTVIT